MRSILAVLSLCLLAAQAAVAAEPTVTIDGSTSFSWVAPTHNSDGSPLTNLAGYKIYVSPVPGSAPGMTYVEILDLPDAGSTSTEFSMPIEDTDDPIFYFVMRAYNDRGDLSVFSNEVRKTLDVTVTDERVPNPPTELKVDMRLTCTSNQTGYTCTVEVIDG